MNLSIVELIKLGQRYIKLWPEKAELAQYFTDYRAVQSARFVCRYFPALALFTFIMQLYLASGFISGFGYIGSSYIGSSYIGSSYIDNVMTALPQALVYGLFLLSIPVQGLVVLGVKADKFLPPSLASWYRTGLEKVKEQNNQDKYADLAVSKPRYIDLAQLLQLTFSYRN